MENQNQSLKKQKKQSNETADILAIGGGVSAICFLSEFTKQEGAKGSKVTVVDSSDFKTIPWHQESSPVPLLQHQSFGDYGEEFLDWVNNNRSNILDFVDKKGGALAKDWLDDNKDFIQNSTKEELVSDWARRFPRAVVGLYLDEKKQEVTERARQNDIKLDFVKGSVRDVEKVQNGYNIMVSSSGLNPISNAIMLNANKILVGIGIPENLEKKSLKNSDGYFGNMYKDKGFERLIDNINKKYEQNDKKKIDVNITGFGPSGLDVAYWLHQHIKADNTFAEKFNLTIIGNISKLRPGAFKSGKESPFSPQFEKTYENGDKLIEDIDKNINLAQEQGYTQGEARTSVREFLKKNINKMPENVQNKFKAAEYMPIYLNKLSSEAKESVSAVENLEKMGVLSFIDAKVDVDSIKPRKEGGFEFKYSGKDKKTHAKNCDIYVNCANNLIKEQEKLASDTWLGKIVNDKDSYLTGFNSFLQKSRQFEPMSVDAQAPAISKFVKRIARDLASELKNAR